MNATADITAIVCFSPDEWDEVKRPQQLMQRLAVRAPVVYVEPPLCATTLLKRAFSPRSPSFSRRVRRALSGTGEELCPGVTVVTPWGLVPEHRLSALPGKGLRELAAHINAMATARRVRKAVGPLDRGAVVAWVGHPTAQHVSTIDTSTTVVYDCVDRWSDFPGPRSDAVLRAQLETAEGDLLSRANVVFCSAEGLLHSCRARAAGTVEILRNAADVDHFRPANRSRPADIEGVTGPVVGYVGAIASWVDLALVRDVARRRRDWSFVIVGGLTEYAFNGRIEDLESLSELPNVWMMGARPYTDVPAYVESFDVALIPFKISGLTEDTNPIKLYEYLACGVPVVSTPLPEAQGVIGVRVADGAEEFERQIEAALAEGKDLRAQRARIDTAECNSWESRAGKAWNILREAIGHVADEPEPPVEMRASA